MSEQNNVTNSLAHTKWNCKYHIVFAPKYRRKVFFEDKREDIREIIRTLCKWKGVDIIEGEICPDHIHLLLSIPPKISVSGFMGYLKGKSSLMIFQKYGNMKFAYRNREFWCKGYYVDTVGKNTKAIKEYIAEQLKLDRETDQLSRPFYGWQVISASWQAYYAHLCAANCIRAMPETEIPPAIEPNPGKRTLRKKASSRSIEATGGFLYGKALLERNTTKGNGNEGSRIYAQANWRGVGI